MYNTSTRAAKEMSVLLVALPALDRTISSLLLLLLFLHRGARHGIRMTGKLRRLAEAESREAMLAAKLKEKQERGAKSTSLVGENMNSRYWQENDNREAVRDIMNQNRSTSQIEWTYKEKKRKARKVNLENENLHVNARDGNNITMESATTAGEECDESNMQHSGSCEQKVIGDKLQVSASDTKQNDDGANISKKKKKKRKKDKSSVIENTTVSDIDSFTEPNYSTSKEDKKRKRKRSKDNNPIHSPEVEECDTQLNKEKKSKKSKRDKSISACENIIEITNAVRKKNKKGKNRHAESVIES